MFLGFAIAAFIGVVLLTWMGIRDGDEDGDVRMLAEVDGSRSSMDRAIVRDYPAGNVRFTGLGGCP